MRVAVKEATGDDPDRHSLDNDDAIHQELSNTGSTHLHHTLIPGKPVDAQAEGLDAKWHGRINRLIMEYCEMGDLGKLITTFQRL